MEEWREGGMEDVGVCGDFLDQRVLSSVSSPFITSQLQVDRHLPSWWLAVLCK